MNKLQRALKSLTDTQRATYELICETKFIRAEGKMKRICRTLFKVGLIKHPKNSDNKHEYVLDGPPVQLPPKKLPSTKSVVDAIMDGAEIEPKHTPMMVVKPLIRSAAVYDNPSREDHVSKWIQKAITPDKKTMVKVKCLKDYQMGYIMIHHEQHTAQEMADKLKVDVMAVKLFCQANAIEPVPAKPKSKRKPADSFHVIPESKRLRMKRIGYNPQNKTA